MKLSFITNINSIHSRRWIKPLISSGHDISVFSYRRNPYQLDGVTNHIDLTRLPNLRKLRFPFWGIWVRRKLRTIKPDILHAHQIQAAGWIGALTGYHPFVVSAWGSDLLIEPNKSLFRNLLFKYVLRKCDYLTVPSKHMFRIAIARGYPQERLSLIPWGVETAIFTNSPDDRADTRKSLKIPEDARVIFCPRRITNICNIDIVIEAVCRVLDEIPDILLILLNFSPDPDYANLIGERIKTLGLQNKVIWLPEQISPQEMARLYRMSDITISIPSSEGYGFTVYEAMSCNSATVISDLPVFEGEMIDNLHTIKVPIRDAEETSKAILRIFRDKKLQKILIENSKNIIAKHELDARISLVDNLYNQIYKQD